MELASRVRSIVYGAEFLDVVAKNVTPGQLHGYGLDGIFHNIGTVVWCSSGESYDVDWVRVLVHSESHVRSLVYSAPLPTVVLGPENPSTSDDLFTFIERYRQHLRSFNHQVYRCDDRVIGIVPLLQTLRVLKMSDMHPELFWILPYLSYLEELTVTHSSMAECVVRPSSTILLPSLRHLALKMLSCTGMLLVFDELVCPILTTVYLDIEFSVTISLKGAEQFVIDLCGRQFFRNEANKYLDISLHLDYFHCTFYDYGANDDEDYRSQGVDFTPFPASIHVLPIRQFAVTMNAASYTAELNLDRLAPAWPRLLSFAFDQRWISGGELRPPSLPFQPLLSSIIGFVLEHQELQVFILPVVRNICQDEIADAERMCSSRSTTGVVCQKELQYLDFGIARTSGVTEREIVIEDPARLGRLLNHVFPGLQDLCYPSHHPSSNTSVYNTLWQHVFGPEQ